MKRSGKMAWHLLLWSLLLLNATKPGAAAGTADPHVSRFFYSGDGRLSLASEKNGKAYSGVYRKASGQYDEAALEAICRVFGAPYEAGRPGVSVRLIEFLDFLQGRLRPEARITITSGYRSPEYNTSVRKRGGLAAKASLHQYGMAADLKMEGVSSKRVWDTVKALNFGGAGYYHGETVHLDTGPARSWDEKTSGVGTGISDDNKLIGIVAEFDIYRAGETLDLRFIRMTAFPIGVAPVFFLDREKSSGGSEQVAAFKPSFAMSAESVCPRFNDIDQMAHVTWRLSTNLAAGRYTVRARFCDNPWKEMPPEIASPAFQVVP